MKITWPQKTCRVGIIFAALFYATVRAQDLDVIGVTLLPAVTTNLNGAGIRVAQPEASVTVDLTSWEVDPAAVGQPASLFTYASGAGSASGVYPNTVGTNSWHAQNVGTNFYRIPGGVATNVAHVDNYEAGYFYNSIINPTPHLLQNINDPIVNQSFIFGSVPDQITVAQQQQIDSAYDDYAAQFKTLFISGAGNSGPASGSVCPPATCYNGIGVGAHDTGASSVGPTLDNGRAKPDITAPSTVTSFSTPYVAGAAALLMQGALRGDGGGDTNSAADIRTIKSLLLNGAIKPADWTNVAPSPLDVRYGAGVLNVFNSYEQLIGGKHRYIVSTGVASGGAHPPTGAGGTESALNGWDFNSISSTSGGILGPASDGVNHYYFNVSNSLAGATFAATATLVWNRQQSQSAINNLNLFLYNAANSNLVACSTSLVDNVEHIFMPRLPPGRYDLQVWKAGGSFVSASESYALAWEFFSQSLSVTSSGANVALAWPVYPAGFVVEATTNLISPVVWSTSGIPSPAVTNSQNYILLNANSAAQFFRLRRP